MNEHILDKIAEICSQTRKDISILRRIGKVYGCETTTQHRETIAQVSINKIKDAMSRHDKINQPAPRIS